MNTLQKVSLLLRPSPANSDPAAICRELLQELPEGSEILLVGADTPLECPHVRVMENTRRFGVSRGFNLAAKEAQGQILLFAEGHFLPRQGWAAPLLSAMENPGTGIAGPVMLSTAEESTHEESQAESQEEALAGLTYMDAAMNTVWMTPGERDYSAPVITGPLLTIRRQDFEALGGFDEGFGDNGFQYHDLSMRMWRFGKECVITPGSRVNYHLPAYQAEGEAWIGYLRDLIRMASLHLSSSELQVFLSTMQDSASFQEANTKLGGDLAERRAEIEAKSVESAGSVLRRLCGSIFRMDDTSDLSAFDEPENTHYSEVNRRAWAHWASIPPEPFFPLAMEEAAAKAYLDPAGWIPWEKIRTVLCLGAGGGNQAPVFARLGYQCTVLDISPGQLALDRDVARRDGLALEILEGDMLELETLCHQTFDLVYQPVCTCYIPDIPALYRQVKKVMAPGGLYLAEHWNPVQMQIENHGRWDGKGYRLVHPRSGNEPVPWIIPGAFSHGKPLAVWHYIHSLNDLIGGLMGSGLSLLSFEESPLGNPQARPGSQEHLASFAPDVIRILAGIPQ